MTGKKIKSAVFHTVGSGVVVTVVNPTKGNVIKSNLFEWDETNQGEDSTASAVLVLT